MKSTNRIRRNGAAKAAESQAKTTPQVKVQPAAAVKKYCLSLMEWEPSKSTDTIVVGEIDVPEGDFEILKMEALNRGDASFSKLLKVAYDAMVSAYPVLELENATAANNALMQLLVENIEFQRRDSGASSFSAGEGSESLSFGIFQLVESCRARLAKAMEVTA